MRKTSVIADQDAGLVGWDVVLKVRPPLRLRRDWPTSAPGLAHVSVAGRAGAAGLGIAAGRGRGAAGAHRILHVRRLRYTYVRACVRACVLGILNCMHAA